MKRNNNGQTKSPQQAGLTPNAALAGWIGKEVKVSLLSEKAKAITGELAGYDAYNIVIHKNGLLIVVPKHDLARIVGPGGKR